MAYITTTDVKLFLGITGSSQDSFIDSLILDAESLINSIFQVDSFSTGTKTEIVKINFKDQIYFLKNYPVTAITKINGVTYTGVLNDDYMIVRDRQILFRTNLVTYLSSLKFDFFEIQYTAGYSTIPDWLKAMTKYAVGGMYNRTKSLGIQEYSLGDERIVFRNGEEMNEFKNLFNSHKKIIVGF